MEVIDSHVHLTMGCQDKEEREGGLPNLWISAMPEGSPFRKEWTPELLHDALGSSPHFKVTQCVFVECFNRPYVEEARRACALAKDPTSPVSAVVAHVPCRSGAVAVKAFLEELGTCEPLKGARQVFLGDPMPPADACLDPTFLEGLRALQELGQNKIHWEWCCHPCALHSVADVMQQMPEMRFVLDHCGHNRGGNDFTSWSADMCHIAESCPNLIGVKMGATEEWDIEDETEIVRYLVHVLRTFGYSRCLAESNWFVCVAEGLNLRYDRNFGLLLKALDHLAATEEEKNMVFVGNARKIYMMT